MDRYETLRQIGRNHYADVWEGNDFQMDRRVAILELHERFFRNDKIREQIWRDVKAMSEVGDKNIVSVHDIVPDRRWIVMELMRGTLGSKIDTQPLSAELGRSVLRQLLEALSAIHNAGRIHGDVKPNNMLYNAEGCVLLSFSPGLYLAGTVPNRQDDQKYQAPELLKTDAFGQVGPGVDLYCLGFSMLALLKGPGFDNLFRGAGVDPKTAWTRWHGDPDQQLPAALSVVPHLPKDIARVIDRLLKKKVSERYQSAEQVLKDLDDAPLELVDVDDEAPAGGSSAGSFRPATKVSYLGDSPALGSAATATQPRPAAKASAAAVKPRKDSVASNPAQPRASKPRAVSKHKPWSRDWINEKLQNPWIMTGVISLMLLPVLIFAIYTFSREETILLRLTSVDPNQWASSAINSFPPTKPDDPPNTPLPPGPSPRPVDRAAVLFLPDQATRLTVKIDGKATQNPAPGDPLWLELSADKVLIDVTADGYQPYHKEIERNQLLALQPFPIQLQPLDTSVPVPPKSGNTDKPDPQPRPISDAQAALDRAVRHLDAAHYAEALAEASRAIELDQELAAAWQTRGMAQLYLDHRDEALADFQQAAKLAPEDALNYLLIGQIHAYAGRFEEAESAFTEAIGRDPKSPSAWTGRCGVYVSQQKYPEALKDADQAIALLPLNAVAYNNKGAALQKLGRVPEAIEAFDEAIRIDPAFTEAIASRGGQYLTLGSTADSRTSIIEYYTKALADFEKVIELRPKYAWGYLGRGIINWRLSTGGFVEQDLTQDALADVNKAIELDPDLREAQLRRKAMLRALEGSK